MADAPPGGAPAPAAPAPAGPPRGPEGRPAEAPGRPAPGKPAPGQPADAGPRDQAGKDVPGGAEAGPPAPPPDPAATAEGMISDGDEGAAGEDKVYAEEIREARTEWQHAGRGDNVAGDKNVYVTVGGKNNTEIRLRAALDDERERSLFFFVAGPGAARVAAAVRRTPVTIVRGEPGSGRTAAALRALAEGDPERIHTLAPQTRLADLYVDQLPPDCRALLLSEEPDERPAPPVRRFDLDDLAARLEKRAIRLVVTVNAATRLPAYGSLVTVVAFGERPAASDVLEANLRFRFRDEFASRGAAVLAHPDLPGLLGRYLGPGSRLAQALELAGCLAECPPGTPSLLEVVDPLMESRGEDDLAVWFSQMKEIRTKCLAIALAVLEGQPPETVSDAAFELLGYLDPRGADRERRERPADPFGLGQAAELADLGAVTELGPQWTRWGMLSLEVVRYQRAGFGPRLFLHVWDEYRAIRRPLVAWLKDLGGHPVPGVRARAATAAGTLAGQVFDHVYGSLLLGWGSSGDRRRQSTAATALAVAGQQSQIRPIVRALVADWEKQQDLDHRCTAVRFYGAGVARDRAVAGGGPRAAVDDDEVLLCLTRLAAARNITPLQGVRVRREVAAALADLVQEDPGWYFGRVVDLLYDWGARHEDSLDMAARFVFVLLARDLVTPSDRGEVTWPTLLRLSAPDEDRRHKVVWLWWAVLNSELSTSARGVLTAWAERCDGDEGARRQMQLLLGDVTFEDRGRVRDTVAWCAREWSGQDGNAVHLGTWVEKELLT